VVPFYAVGSVLLLLAVVAFRPAQRFLDSRPLAFVGRRSYSLYLSQIGPPWWNRDPAEDVDNAAAVAGVGSVGSRVGCPGGCGNPKLWGSCAGCWSLAGSGERADNSQMGLTPLGAVWRGLVAGAAGTLAMDLYWFARSRAANGDRNFWAWETSVGLDSWEKAPAPAQVGRRIAEGLLGRELPAQRARLVNNVVHWVYGTVWGAVYGIVAGSTADPQTSYGLPLGAVVLAADYTVLPSAKLYKPIWEYDAKAVAADVGGHLVYGVSTAAAFRRLS
jgi:hypothetical protein